MIYQVACPHFQAVCLSLPPFDANRSAPIWSKIAVKGKCYGRAKRYNRSPKPVKTPALGTAQAASFLRGTRVVSVAWHVAPTPGGSHPASVMGRYGCGTQPPTNVRLMAGAPDSKSSARLAGPWGRDRGKIGEDIARATPMLVLCNCPMTFTHSEVSLCGENAFLLMSRPSFIRVDPRHPWLRSCGRSGGVGAEKQARDHVRRPSGP